MSPAPPCTSTMGSIATFVYRRIRIICKMLFRKFTIQKSFVDIYTHIHLIYSNFIVSNSANQFPVWKPGAATVSMYCTYAKKKKQRFNIERMLLRLAQQGERPDQYKQIVCNKIYFSIYFFVLFKSFASFATTSDIENISIKREAKGRTNKTNFKSKKLNSLFSMCSAARIHSNTANNHVHHFLCYIKLRLRLGLSTAIKLYVTISTKIFVAKASHSAILIYHAPLAINVHNMQHADGSKGINKEQYSRTEPK